MRPRVHLGEPQPSGGRHAGQGIRLGGQQRLGVLGYSLAAEDGGTRLTESWKFLPPGIAGFHEIFGERAESEIEARRLAAESGIPATLTAIKAIAEAG